MLQEKIVAPRFELSRKNTGRSIIRNRIFLRHKQSGRRWREPMQRERPGSREARQVVGGVSA